MEASSTPLIVDLDHTLIDTDLLFLSSLGVLTKSPWLIAHYFFWLWKGKGYLKDQLVKRFEINIPELPYNESVISYIMKRKKEGSKIVLATASHKNYAFAVAKHLQIFDDVMASNKDFNLSSHNKANSLVKRFGEKNFDYMGDHIRDLPVWEVSRLSIIVNATNRIITSTKHLKTLVISSKA
ncbi:MAG: phosphoserine phosphatase [Brevundimonas sp.]|jgi:phosphoserine phosphatase|tara:strand:+ start:1829 stop:2374 length:546 start_codon:yes stop_codon:yes gene_type:complete